MIGVHRAETVDPLAEASTGKRGVKTLVAVVCAAAFVFSAGFNVLNDYLGVAILTVAALVGFPGAGRSSLASTVVFSSVALFTLPYIGLYYVGYDVMTAWFALYILCGMALVAWGETPLPDTRPGYGWLDLPLVIVFLIGGLLLWSNDGLRQVTFYAGWAMALVHLERMHVQTASKLYRGAGLLVFGLVIGYFVTFLWAGGGRIVQLSFALAVILLTVHYRTFRLSGLVLASVAVALSFIGRLIRFGWSDGVAGLADDSGASPITLTTYLWTTKDAIFATGSIAGQWVLLFLNWFPRELWPGKPVGIGSTFVDMVFGRTGFSAEHNLAIGMFGEHLFYLPNFWWVSVLLLIAVIIGIRRLIARACSPYRAPVIVLDVWLITLFWGGMAAFASRAWYALVPLLPYMVLIKWLDRNRRQVRQPELRSVTS